VDPPLTRWRSADPAPAEHAASPALAAAGRRPDPIVCGPTPSKCVVAAPGLASPPDPVIVVLPPHPSGMPAPEPSEEGSLPTPEIQLHIVINVVSRLNTVEDFRSLSNEELSLHEFLLDQILLL
jgi:hypothetical protein